MAKGPSYTGEEQKLLNKLAKKGGSPTVLAAEFQSVHGHMRSLPALVQKIRKMILDLNGSAPSEASTGKKRGRPAKVNAAPLSDVPPAPAAGKKLGRPRKAPGAASSPLTVAGGNGAGNGHTNGNGGDVTVDLGGLKLVGSKKRVAETLLQLG